MYVALNALIVMLAGIVLSVVESVLQIVEHRADIYLEALSFVPVFAASWSFITVHRNGCVKTVFDEEEDVAAICSAAGSPKFFADFCVRKLQTLLGST